MFASNGLSGSDVALISGAARNNDGFGDGAFAWWIILLAVLGGWGRNGLFGGGNGAGACCQPATCQEVQAGFNNQSVMQQFTGLANGISALGYDQQAQMNNLGREVNATGYNILNAIQQGQFANQQCCCETQRAIDGVNYNMAQHFCNLGNTVSTGFAQAGYNAAMNTNAIVQNGHDDTNRVLAKLDAMENARMQERIHSLESENQSLRFQASQTAQNAFISANQQAQTAEILRRTGNDCPVAAYVVQPPTPVTFPTQCQNYCYGTAA